MKVKKKIVLAVVLAIFIFIVIGVAAYYVPPPPSLISTPAPSVVTPSPSATQFTPTPSPTIQILDVKILNYNRTVIGPKAHSLPPDEGNEFFVMNISITNVGTDDRWVSFTDFSASTKSGLQASEDAFQSDMKYFLKDTLLNPGRSLKGIITYQEPFNDKITLVDYDNINGPTSVHYEWKIAS